MDANNFNCLWWLLCCSRTLKRMALKQSADMRRTTTATPSWPVGYAGRFHFWKPTRNLPGNFHEVL